MHFLAPPVGRCDLEISGKSYIGLCIVLKVGLGSIVIVIDQLIKSPPVAALRFHTFLPSTTLLYYRAFCFHAGSSLLAPWSRWTWSNKIVGGNIIGLIHGLRFEFQATQIPQALNSNAKNG